MNWIKLKIKDPLKKVRYNQNAQAPNLLFLDFDGVIFSLNLAPEHLMRHVNELVEKFDFHIVVSSSWRFDWDLAMGILKDYRCRGIIDGKTELLNQSREVEIMDYLAHHSFRHILILDDAKLKSLAPYQIQTTMETGFDAFCLKKAIQRFKKIVRVEGGGS